MLYLIGLGLCDENDISLKGLKIVQRCAKVYLESYTSLLQISRENLEKLYGKEIIIADRELVEKKAEDTILAEAKKSDVAFLVIGDVFGATTHTDLVMRARKEGIKVGYVHNASILNAVGVTGLELYKFGNTTSMPFFDGAWKPQTAYDVIVMNRKNGLHTLVLCDIKVAEPTKEDLRKGGVKTQPPRFMTVKECVAQLLELEEINKKGILTQKTKLIGCARVGCGDQEIMYGTASELMKHDFGKPLHSLIVPGELHFLEEEFLDTLK